MTGCDKQKTVQSKNAHDCCSRSSQDTSVTAVGHDEFSGTCTLYHGSNCKTATLGPPTSPSNRLRRLSVSNTSDQPVSPAFIVINRSSFSMASFQSTELVPSLQGSSAVLYVKQNRIYSAPFVKRHHSSTSVVHRLVRLTGGVVVVQIDGGFEQLDADGTSGAVPDPSDAFIRANTREGGFLDQSDGSSTLVHGGDVVYTAMHFTLTDPMVNLGIGQINLTNTMVPFYSHPAPQGPHEAICLFRLQLDSGGTSECSALGFIGKDNTWNVVATPRGGVMLYFQTGSIDDQQTIVADFYTHGMNPEEFRLNKKIDGQHVYAAHLDGVGCKWTWFKDLGQGSQPLWMGESKSGSGVFVVAKYESGVLPFKRGNTGQSEPQTGFFVGVASVQHNANSVGIIQGIGDIRSYLLWNSLTETITWSNVHGIETQDGELLLSFVLTGELRFHNDGGTSECSTSCAPTSCIILLKLSFVSDGSGGSRCEWMSVVKIVEDSSTSSKQFDGVSLHVSPVESAVEDTRQTFVLSGSVDPADVIFEHGNSTEVTQGHVPKQIELRGASLTRVSAFLALIDERGHWNDAEWLMPSSSSWQAGLTVRGLTYGDNGGFLLVGEEWQPSSPTSKTGFVALTHAFGDRGSQQQLLPPEDESGGLSYGLVVFLTVMGTLVALLALGCIYQTWCNTTKISTVRKDNIDPEKSSTAEAVAISFVRIPHGRWE